MDIIRLNSIIDKAIEINRALIAKKEPDWVLVKLSNDIYRQAMQERIEWVDEKKELISMAVIWELDIARELYHDDPEFPYIPSNDLELDAYGVLVVSKQRIENDLQGIMSTLSTEDIIQISNLDAFINMANTYDPVNEVFNDSSLCDFVIEFFNYVLDGDTILKYVKSIGF